MTEKVPRSKTAGLADDLSVKLPTTGELKDMREERGIKGTHMAEVIGMSGNGWHSAEAKKTLSPKYRFMALVVFEFYDRYGYLPIIEVR